MVQNLLVVSIWSLCLMCDPTESFQSKPFHPIMMDTVATIAQLVEAGVYKELSPVSLLGLSCETLLTEPAVGAYWSGAFVSGINHFQ